MNVDQISCARNSSECLPLLLEKLSDKYSSLHNIKLSEFYASARIKKKARPGSDAIVSVNLVLENIKIVLV